MRARRPLDRPPRTVLRARCVTGREPVRNVVAARRRRPPRQRILTTMPVPDDAAALDADRDAWLAEQRVARRRGRLRRLLLTRRWERFGLSGPVLVLCLLVTALVGALASVLGPRPPTPPPAARPPAPVPAVDVPAGAAAGDVPAVERRGAIVGRRLPDTALAADVRPLTALAVRPAMVLLVPPRCGCGGAVDELYRQAREFRVEVWLVAAGGPDAAGTAATRRQLADLDARETAGGARWAVDPDGALFRALRARGLTLVLVGPDGVVEALARDVGPGADGVPATEIALAALVPPR